MEWYLEGAEQVSDLRRELGDYLRRHAAPGSEDDVADAQLIVSESVGNAIRHTDGPVWVSLAWTTPHPELRVHDVGAGFDIAQLDSGPSAPGDLGEPGDLDDSGRGLLIVSTLAPRVRTALRAHSGTLVDITLPVSRRSEHALPPPLRRGNVLPRLDEATPGRGFGKEAFLRALVVQLARALEDAHGPVAAEAAVAQVGTDVGGQMEAEFRLAEAVVGTMSPEQLGRCFVRLKHAIDGGFSVVEATPRRIVLENTRCPFGEAVRASPALCRMTSSVFGGIAARNTAEGAAVLLEERLAVGDPGCRVVVLLSAVADDEAPFVHRYPAPAVSA